MILVTGATGHFGNAALQTLLKKGIPASKITALVRDEKKAGDLKNQGITVKTGNYDDYESLEKAFEGVDKLLFISSNDPEHGLDQHKNVLNAAKKNNVGHIVYTSQETRNGKHTSIPFVIGIHKATADLIINSGITYTILNNTLYADSIDKFIGENYLETGIFFPAGDGKIPFMPRAEMAEAAAEVLAGTGHEHKIYSIAGEKAYSFDDIAELLSAIKGKKITYHKPDANTFIDTVVNAGVPKELASFLGSFGDGMANGEFDTQRSDVKHLIGRKPMELEEFLKITYGK
jgi:NAD(P)H dehydrogenase (quinone)